MVKPKKPVPDFVKIDYLRFENKEEAIGFSQNNSPSKSRKKQQSKEKAVTVPMYKVPHKTGQV